MRAVSLFSCDPAASGTGSHQAGSASAARPPIPLPGGAARQCPGCGSDINEPGRFVEVIEDDSWIDHLRRFERVSASDVALRERKMAYHLGEDPPVVRRAVRESTVRGGRKVFESN